MKEPSVDKTDSRAAENDDVVSDTSRLVDVRESGRELVSSERVWSGPIFAVDADQVRLGPGRRRRRRSARSRPAR